MIDPQDELHPDLQLLLRDVVVGDQDEHGPAVAAAMSDAAFRAALERLQRTQQALDSAAAAGPGSATAALRQPESAVVRDTIAKLAGVPVSSLEPASPRSAHRGLFVALAVAAALLLVLLLIRDRSTRTDDAVIGSSELELLDPHTTSTGGLELSWRCSIAGASFAVLVYDPDRPEDRPILFREPSSSTSWTLDHNTLANLRSGLRWRVVATVKQRSFAADKRLR